MLSRKIGVSSNLVSYGKGKPARFLETVTLCEAFRGNFRRTGSSLCYHTISVHTCFCVCIYLIFRFAYLAYCLCAILFSVSHSSIMNIFCCLCYMPSGYLKCLMFALCFLSFILHIMQEFNILFIWLKITAAMYIYVYISIYIYRPVETGGLGGFSPPPPRFC